MTAYKSQKSQRTNPIILYSASAACVWLYEVHGIEVSLHTAQRRIKAAALAERAVSGDPRQYQIIQRKPQRLCWCAPASWWLQEFTERPVLRGRPRKHE